jgi:lysophospholipase L1-like esterase
MALRSSVPPGRHSSRRIAALALAGLAALVALDLGLGHFADRFGVSRLDKVYRVPSSRYHHDLAPMTDAMARWAHIRYPLRTNSLGFLDASNRVVALEPAHRRILLIGDGFTEGLGVAFESTFAGRIATQLAASEVDVLNAAVSSYSPAIYYRKVKYLIEDVHLRFDELVVFIDMTDVRDETLYELDADDRVVARVQPEGVIHSESLVPRSRSRALDEFLKRHSLAVRLLVNLRDAARERTRRIGEDPTREPSWRRDVARWTLDPALLDAWGREGLERAGRSMARLAEVLRVRGIPLTICVYPWPDQLLGGDRDSLQARFWRSWAVRHDAGFVDLFPGFFAELDAGGASEDLVRRFYDSGGVHFNEAGHRFVAREFLALWRPQAREPRSD